MSDEDLFFEAMRGVKPLRGKARVEKRLRSEQPLRPDPPKASEEPSELVAGQLVLIGNAIVQPGVSLDRVRRAASGKESIGMEIDLHGMTRQEAIDLLCERLSQAQRAGIRIVRIVHGRGLHSPQRKPILREAIYEWFQLGPGAAFALAVCPEKGSGGGASIVILRRKKTRAA